MKKRKVNNRYINLVVAVPCVADARMVLSDARDRSLCLPVAHVGELVTAVTLRRLHCIISFLAVFCDQFFFYCSPKHSKKCAGQFNKSRYPVN